MYGAKMADGVYSVQTLIDRSPSCPAWWTLSSPSWTTYEGGKSSRGPSLVCEWLLGGKLCLSVSWNIQTDNLLLNYPLLPALNQAAL